MTGYQFIHIECYGRSAGKGKAGGHTVKSIVDEAERRPGNHPHVSRPQKPKLIYGIAPSKAGLLAEKRAEQGKDPSGRKIRKDALIFLAGIASFPHTVADCKADKTLLNEYLEWEKETLEFLKQEYGDNLKSVIRHTDESYAHVHFFAVPELEPRNAFNLNNIHPGRKASAEAQSKGLKKGQQNLAYKGAMRDFQDRYANQVAQRFGMTRLGPKKRRLTRAEWKNEQKQAQSLKIAKEKADQIQIKIDYAERLRHSLSDHVKFLSSQYKKLKKETHHPKIQSLKGDVSRLTAQNQNLKKQIQILLGSKEALATERNEARSRCNELEAALIQHVPSHDLCPRSMEDAIRELKYQKR